MIPEYLLFNLSTWFSFGLWIALPDLGCCHHLSIKKRQKNNLYHNVQISLHSFFFETEISLHSLSVISNTIP